MIRRVSDSVETTYTFRHNMLSSSQLPYPPAGYCVCINTGRVSLETPEMPVPAVGRLPTMVESYRAMFAALLQGAKNADTCTELRHSIVRELLNHFPIPEFMHYQHRGRYYAI